MLHRLVYGHWPRREITGYDGISNVHECIKCPHNHAPHMKVEWKGTPFKNAKPIKPYWICYCGEPVKGTQL